MQGVGFRFTAREIARDLRVAGWIKNLADGKVEVVAEAEEGILINFLTEINRYFSRAIQDTDVQWTAEMGEYKEFEVRF